MRDFAGSARSVADAARRKELRRVLLSSCIGSAIEYYDFLLYVAAASLIFGRLFFSNLTPVMATIASLGTLAVGYVSRPLGAVFFGHFGDRYGRKSVLIATLITMGVSTTLIGLLPTSAQIGIWSPAALVFLRMLQGVSVGGEWGGGALMAFEHAPEHRRGFASSCSVAGGPAGTMLAAGVLSLFALLPQSQFLAWGWRVPFLLSAVLVGVGFWMRIRVAESPLFVEAQRKRQATGAKHKPPLFDVLRAPKPLLVGFISMLAPFTLYSLVASFGLTYSRKHGLPISSVLAIQATGAVFCAFSEVLCGYLSDRVSRHSVLIFGITAGALLAYPYLLLLASGDVFKTTAGFLLMNVCVIGPVLGPSAAYLAEQFDTHSRYTGASLGLQAASTVGAGFAPITLASLLVLNAGGYQLILAFIVTICLLSGAVIGIRANTRRRRQGHAISTIIAAPANGDHRN
ncbi:MFS transporter [Burkholderia anthina]|uniref:MFS transporter n=1 Tax=Burkholderia anthina TaxID=179879 RepID=UPI00158A95FF|nr:MFS transporter [Burkholderia anthina]